MDVDVELEEGLATITRIFAMRGLLGLHGHVSAYSPERGHVYLSPGFGSDKPTTQRDELFVFDLDGRILVGEGRRPPLEWPIHTALHRLRPEIGAIAHLHSPYATLFAAARTEFRPVLLSAALLGRVPIYQERRLITTAEQGQAVAELVGPGRAALLRNHGTVVAGKDMQELLFTSLLLEDSARAAVQAAALGEPDYLDPEVDAHLDTDATIQIRARMTWDHFVRLEARWDRQPPTGSVPLA